MRLIPSSKAIVSACLDFGPSAEYAKKQWGKIDGLKNVEKCWGGTYLHFLTESIQPGVTCRKGPRVMLLFSNPHPGSIEEGLFIPRETQESSGTYYAILSSWV